MINIMKKSILSNQSSVMLIIRSSTVIGLAIVAGLIAFLALFLNVLVIATVLNVKRNRRSPFDYVKMSLAVADLLWGRYVYIINCS